MAFLVEMVMDGRVDGDEFLQTSHLPEAEHRASGDNGNRTYNITAMRMISGLVLK